MFICLKCNRLFEEPKRYVETHGLDTPPYEEYYGCRYCGSTYADAYECECCGRYIDSNYIKINDLRYCQDCYVEYELGEE